MTNYHQVSNAYEKYYASLILYAIKWLHDEHLAKDVVQSVFIKLLEKKNKSKIQDYRAYLYQSVRNECINSIKKNSGKTDQLVESEENRFGYFKDPVEEAEFEAYVFRLIDDLPPATKNIFKLNRFEGFSNQEIAEKLNISKRTVELQISNALKILREKLFDAQNEKSDFSPFLFLLF